MSRKATILIITYLTAAAIALGAYSYALSLNGGAYRNTAVYGYQHAFEEVVLAADSLDDALRRGSYTTGAELSAAVSAEIYACCLAAQMTMAALPFSTAELEQTAGFMGIAGDYACSLLRSCAKTGFGDDERKNLAALADISASITEVLTQLQTDIRSGNVIMDEPENVFSDNSEQALMSRALLELEGSLPELPELSYDGKYTPQKLTEYKNPVSEDEAKKAAAELFGFDENELKAEFTTESGNICLSFDGGTVIVDGGGNVVSMSSERIVVGNMSDGELRDIALRFISDAGFGNMELRSSERSNDVLYCDFVCTFDGAYCLREVIRIGIAGDSGEVCSYDAREYVKNHSERESVSAGVSEDEAKNAIPAGLSIVSSHLDYVGTEGKSERLCYGFDCTDGDRSLLIYVDANTGEQYRVEL